MEVKTPQGDRVDGAKLLMELINGTEPLGIGKVVAAAALPFTLDDAQEILSGMDEFTFDYMLGRPLKMSSKRRVIDERAVRMYDRDAGQGAFYKAVERALLNS